MDPEFYTNTINIIKLVVSLTYPFARSQLCFLTSTKTKV
jgi:hypothetical protein